MLSQRTPLKNFSQPLLFPACEPLSGPLMCVLQATRPPPGAWASLSPQLCCSRNPPCSKSAFQCGRVCILWLWAEGSGTRGGFLALHEQWTRDHTCSLTVRKLGYTGLLYKFSGALKFVRCTYIK